MYVVKTFCCKKWAYCGFIFPPYEYTICLVVKYSVLNLEVIGVKTKLSFLAQTCPKTHNIRMVVLASTNVCVRKALSRTQTVVLIFFTSLFEPMHCHATCTNHF